MSEQDKRAEEVAQDILCAVDADWLDFIGQASPILAAALSPQAGPGAEGPEEESRG